METLIELIDVMGNDLTVVNAARVSMHKKSAWGEDGNLKEKDVRLIEYLAKNRHWTPFASPQLQFRIKMPIFVKNQWFRHTIGFVRNEVSRRYVKESPEFYIPDYFRPNPENIKQGSLDIPHDNSEMWKQELSRHYQESEELYLAMLNNGVCAEQARIHLPMGMFTEFIETGSLYAYAHLYGLRSKPDAQKEIRVYSDEIGKHISNIFPISWKALTENS